MGDDAQDPAIGRPTDDKEDIVLLLRWDVTDVYRKQPQLPNPDGNNGVLDMLCVRDVRRHVTPSRAMNDENIRDSSVTVGS